MTATKTNVQDMLENLMKQSEPNEEKSEADKEKIKVIDLINEEFL